MPGHVLVNASAKAIPFMSPSDFPEKVGAVMKGQTVMATGCLTQEPKEKNEYMITGEDGNAAPRRVRGPEER
jgi:hypothetical protein